MPEPRTVELMGARVQVALAQPLRLTRCGIDSSVAAGFCRWSSAS
jgi:hypothetical protein